MRTLRKNEQKMFYSLFVSNAPKYELDEYGNRIIDSFDDFGNPIYLEVGENEDTYSAPVEFWASIDGNVRQTLMQEFGTINSPNYAQIVARTGLYDFKVGTLIWKDSEIVYKADGTPDESSADYDVIGVLDEQVDNTTFYLHKNVK
jgi:hypothetical protein